MLVQYPAAGRTQFSTVQAASRKRQAESGKPKAASQKRQAESGKPKASKREARTMLKREASNRESLSRQVERMQNAEFATHSTTKLSCKPYKTFGSRCKISWNPERGIQYIFYEEADDALNSNGRGECWKSLSSQMKKETRMPKGLSPTGYNKPFGIRVSFSRYIQPLPLPKTNSQCNKSKRGFTAIEKTAQRIN